MVAPLPPVRVTDRDLDVLDALGEHRFLGLAQLAALHFPTPGAAEARLRRLHAHGLVARVFMPVRPYDRHAHSIYGLAAKGARLLAPRHEGAIPPHLSPRDQRSALFLDHTLRRNDLHICLQLLDRNPTSRLALESWQHAPDHLRASARIRLPSRRTERVPLVADAGCLVAVAGHRHAFLVEIDMGTVRLDRMALRYRGYWQWWKDGDAGRRYGHVPLRVLTLAPTLRRCEALRKAAVHAPGEAGLGSGLFWFTTLDQADLRDPARLLGPVWTVARTGLRPPEPLFRQFP